LYAYASLAILRSALIRGGLDPETLDVLIAGEAEPEETDHHNGNTKSNVHESNLRKPKTVPVTARPANGHSMADDSEDWYEKNGSRLNPQASSHKEKSFGIASYEDDFCDNEPGLRKIPMQSPPSEQRTISLASLQPDTTHKDLVNVIRGGRLLDIYLRNDRAAQVTFMEGAQDFLNYAKKNGLYIRNKRIEVRWADRQFHVPSHVSNKISTGATRNIVIRNSADKLTENIIRNDLDHIHNLVVMDVQILNNDIFISMNSVHNALFARTCMMSRKMYRGLKIEWYPDECAAPLPKSPTMPRTAPDVPNKPSQQVKVGATRVSPPANRFGVLDMEDGEASDEESDDDPTGCTGYGVGLNWAGTGIAV